MSAKLRHVVVAGGGIAGIACAIRLAEHGVRVTLLEAGRRLGGRASSFDDPRSGEVLDNCQHVTLAACSAYLDLLERLDARRKLRWTTSQAWITEGGMVHGVSPGIAPAPLHFAGSVLRSGLLTLPEGLVLGAACRAILKADRREHAGETFAQWLSKHGQTERLLKRFWEPVVVSACNLSVERVAASVALHVFQEGFLASRGCASIGLPSCPLRELYERVPQLIEAAGGTVRLGSRVESLGLGSVTLSGGETIEADRVVCALPLEGTRELVEPEARDERWEGLGAIGYSPILGVHLSFDRSVLGLPHAVLVERATQWLFAKSDDGTKIHAVVSAADEWLGLSPQQMVDRVLLDVGACLPHATEARLVSARPVMEKRATFAATPETEAVRPAVTGPSGCVLAGDFVRTGWPATMEGATRAGYAAAAEVLGAEPAELVPAARPIDRLPRLLGLRTPPDPLTIGA